MKQLNEKEIREELKKVNAEIVKIPPIYKPSMDEKAHSKKLWTKKRKLLSQLNKYNQEQYA
jgi:hypothetical protein